MDNPTIFKCATEAWTKYKELITPGDIGVRFSNGKMLRFHSFVLKQIKFFAELFNSGLELPIIDGIPIVLDLDSSRDYISINIFLFFYYRLEEQYSDTVFDAFNIRGYIGIDAKLDSPIDQLNYIKLLDYLTDPDERENLTNSIYWYDLFWMGILGEKNSNLKTFFDIKTLVDAYNVCCRLVPEITEDDKNEIKNFFGINNLDIIDAINEVPKLVPCDSIPSNVTHLTFGYNLNLPFH